MNCKNNLMTQSYKIKLKYKKFMKKIKYKKNMIAQTK